MIGSKKEMNKFFLFKLAKVRRKFFNLRAHLKKSVSDSVLRRTLIKETKEIESNMQDLVEKQKKDFKTMFCDMETQAKIKEQCIRAKILAEIAERQNK